MATQTFEEIIAEYIDRSKELIGQESLENLPPGMPTPYDQAGPPYECPIRFDSHTIRNHALTIGDDNPLYTDPEYGKATRYGSQLAPGSMLAMVRYPSVHGAVREGGYPYAQFFSGTAWEFFDVIRVGTKIRSSKTTSELIEKPSADKRLIFLISELFFHDYHGDIPAKCYGTQIMVPRENMGTNKHTPVERLGEQLLYERGTHKYTLEAVEETIAMLDKMPPRRGAEILYWEDVQIGDMMGPLSLPPWTLQDQEAYHLLGYTAARKGELDDNGDEYAFEQAYYNSKRNTARARVNPLTGWPWTPNNVHEDAVLAAYNSLPGPFDFGVQRVMIPEQLVTNWIGDEGFIRRMYLPMRKPVFYGDATYYTGEVVKKFKETQKGAEGRGGIPGNVEYHAVGIRINGTNQIGQTQLMGTATAYLPSRDTGQVILPIPHPVRPPYVPFEVHYKDWY